MLRKQMAETEKEAQREIEENKRRQAGSGKKQ